MGKKSKATNKPWSKAQPYLLEGADTVKGVYSQNAPGLQQATSQVTGLLPGIIDKYKAGDPGLTAAQGYNTDVLGGKFLDQGNPYLQGMIDQTGDDLRNQVGAAMGTRGLTGGSSHAQILARELARAGLGMRYQDYGAERDRMGQAVSSTGGLLAGDNLRMGPMMSLLGAYDAPMNAASQYAGSLGGLLGGYQTQTKRPSTAQSIGQGLETAGSLLGILSDVRAKTDIRLVGETFDGLPVYTFRYIDDPVTHMGVMAQEVAQMQPGAIGPEVAGYMTVNYAEVR